MWVKSAATVAFPGRSSGPAQNLRLRSAWWRAERRYGSLYCNIAGAYVTLLYTQCAFILLNVLINLCLNWNIDVMDEAVRAWHISNHTLPSIWPYSTLTTHPEHSTHHSISSSSRSAPTISKSCSSTTRPTYWFVEQEPLTPFVPWSDWEIVGRWVPLSSPLLHTWSTVSLHAVADTTAWLLPLQTTVTKPCTLILTRLHTGCTGLVSTAWISVLRNSYNMLLYEDRPPTNKWTHEKIPYRKYV